MADTCAHLDGVSFDDVVATECPACVELGDTWVNLRACVECGGIGCCDSSKNKHASAHARDHGHPTARSAMPGERWVYCYVDEVVAQP